MSYECLAGLLLFLTTAVFFAAGFLVAGFLVVGVAIVHYFNTPHYSWHNWFDKIYKFLGAGKSNYNIVR
jgi:hypothetical protein